MLPWKKNLLRSGMSLASLLLLAGTAFARDLYWTEQKQILASDIDGGNVTLIFDGETSTPPMDSFAVDIQVTDDHIYWSGHDGGDIWRADRDGNNAVQLVSGTNSSIHSFDIDEDGGKIYFTDYSGRIMVADLADGANVTVGVSDSRLGQPSGLAIDRTATGEDAQILTVTANGSYLHRSEISEEWGGWYLRYDDLEGGNGIYGLAFDDSTNTVYYTNFNEDTLRSFNLDTKEHELLWAPDMTQPLAVKLSPSRTHLLIAERGRGISGFELATGGYELLVDAPDAHFGVGVTADPGTLELPPPPPPPPGDGDTIFFADFEEDIIGGPPGIGWGALVKGANGIAEVMEDTENAFGFGTDNRFFRIEGVDSMNLVTETFSHPLEVMTLSFDMIGYHHSEDEGRWLNIHLRAGSARTHITSIVMTGQYLRGPNNAPYGDNEVPLRMETIMNNSEETITYENPFGEIEELPSGLATVWVFDHTSTVWTQLEKAYVYADTFTTRGAHMDSIRFDIDRDAGRSIDLDNIRVIMGAHLSDLEGTPPPPIPYPEEPVLVAFDDFDQYDEPFQVTEIEDYQGPFTLSRINNDNLNPDGTLHIVRDTENWFNRGPDNMVLYMNNTVQTWLDLPVGELETGVATVAFDMYHDGRHANGIVNRLGARFHTTAINNSNIVHNFGFEGSPPREAHEGPYFVRGLSGRTIHPGYLQRWAVVTNNTRRTITYDTPRGELELSPSRSHVWLNGHLFNEEYAYGSAQNEQLIRSFRFDSFNNWTAYIDNLQVWEGAIVPGPNFQRQSEPTERDLLVYEGFDYAPGNLDGRDGGIGWAEGWTTLDDFDSAVVIEPGLEWPNLPVTGNSVRAAGPTPESSNSDGTRNFRLIDIDGIHSSMLNELSGYTHIGPHGGTVWLSVVGRGNPNQSGTFWGLSLYRDTSEQSGEVLFLGKGSPDTEEDGWRFAGGGGSTTSGSIRTQQALTDKHFWAIRIDYNDNGNQVAHLYHNPDPSGPEPIEPTISRTTGVGSFGFDRVRIAGNGAGFVIDEIRIGTSWRAVAAPEDRPSFPEGYAAWLDLHFPGENSLSVIGPAADPDGDGVSNLVEYALGMDPNNASREGLPVLGETVIEGERYLTLTGTLPDGTNLDLAVEATSDLADWSEPDLGVPLGATPNGDGTTTYIFRDVEPIDSSGRRFMRLHVDFRVD